MLIAVVMLLLRGGDCVSLLFADQQTKECCTKGHCSPGQKADPCCESSSSAPIKYFQAQGKFSIPPLSDVAVALFAEAVPQLMSADPRPFVPGFLFQSPPPGASSQAPVPLLI